MFARGEKLRQEVSVSSKKYVSLQMVKVVSFMGDGFIELNGQSLGRKSSIGLVFATTQPDALLLFSEPVKIEVCSCYI